MSKFLRLALCITALLVWSREAQSQRGTSGSGSATVPGNQRKNNEPVSSAPTTWMVQSNGGIRMGVGVSAGAPAAVTDPGFASRLGYNVGLRAVPPVAMPPGVGNINHPGMQPMPMTSQPLPTGSAPPIPNINFPGGAPGMRETPSNHSGDSFDRGRDHRFPQDHLRKHFRGSSTIVVGVPYPIYITIPSTTASSTIENVPYTGQPSGSAAEPVITLLAFKDGSVFAAVDYWLDEDFLRYITVQGMRASVPLDRLDLSLTQKLNRERNVRFVLEARP
ncbi:MAG: hypothetical protein HY313_06410 [Acidobacteria bacterium]|nr:hypothetical protein [Acidobacteriota bacterium]